MPRAVLLLSSIETRLSLCRNEAIVELKAGGFEPVCRGNYLIDFTGERLQRTGVKPR